MQTSNNHHSLLIQTAKLDALQWQVKYKSTLQKLQTILLHYKRIYSDQNFTKAARNDLKMAKSGLVSGSGRFLDAPPHDSLLMETRKRTNQFTNIQKYSCSRIQELERKENQSNEFREMVATCTYRLILFNVGLLCFCES